jgi:hypothetical protein
VLGTELCSGGTAGNKTDKTYPPPSVGTLTIDKIKLWLGVVVHACNPSYREAEVEGPTRAKVQDSL